MRTYLIVPALMLMAACGQTGGEKAGGGAAGGGSNSATITEGTINDDMIDLSESEGYGVTSTVVEVPAAPADKAAKAADKPKAAPKPKADEPKTAPTPEPKSEDADAE